MASTPSRKADQTALEEHPGKSLVRRKHAQVVKPGRLPVTEVAFDRAGAASPFGDDIAFPVPPERLTYVHPSEEG